jgi:hypothetical protein
MTDRAEPVLAGALRQLVENGTLTQEQADVVRTDFHARLQTDSSGLSGPGHMGQQPGNAWTAVLAEVGGYVGAAFVVAAAVALVGPDWANFAQSTRIAILAGPGVLLLLAALATALAVPGGWSFRPAAAERDGHASAAIRRLIGALVLAGGGLLGGATEVIREDHGSNYWIPLVLLLVWGIGYLLCRGVPLHLGTAGALVWTLLTAVNTDYENFPVVGMTLVIAGVGWLLLGLYGLIEERTLAIETAGVMAFIGGEFAATSDVEGLGYALLGLLAVAGLTGYVRTHELSTLGVGAVALAVVVPEAVTDYTEGSLGAAGGLLVSGLSVVAVSVLAARLRRSDSGKPASGPAKVV